MTIATDIFMNIEDDISARVAGGVTRGIPDKVCYIVTGMGYRAIGVTIKAANRRASHDDIVDRGVASTKICGPGRLVTLRATNLVQGADTIRARPGISEQGICGSRTTSAMAGITRCRTRQICRPLQDGMR